MIRFLPLLLVLSAPLAIAGPYPGPAGTAGSDAIVYNDARFVNWASGHLDYAFGTSVVAQWRTPAKAYGPATTDTLDIVCLGDNGKITLFFPHPIRDGEGADFAVFENSFSATFLELAFVEVSSDGVNFVRFPNASLSTGTVGGFGSVDATNISGFAGKHKVGFGTPFDLASLPASPLLDRDHVCFVRLIDIVGDGSAKDSSNRTILDPYPTTGSAGFDLEAIGVINQNTGDFRMFPSVVTATTCELEWESNPGRSYQIETSTSLANWTPVQTVIARPDRGSSLFTAPRSTAPTQYWRVTRVGD
ncbi:hypothetical protein [Haloferula sp. BvORR071]|uniref:hypothetical protein n=1 Tax=Haloferula sp. BvORR071 TaxID=1396141 RepID=UPI000696F13D|nr:hypothetical protein [Haloferula sp. BvORR071]